MSYINEVIFFELFREIRGHLIPFYKIVNHKKSAFKGRPGITISGIYIRRPEETSDPISMMSKFC